MTSGVIAEAPGLPGNQKKPFHLVEASAGFVSELRSGHGAEPYGREPVIPGLASRRVASACVLSDSVGGTVLWIKNSILPCRRPWLVTGRESPGRPIPSRSRNQTPVPAR